MCRTMGHCAYKCRWDFFPCLAVNMGNVKDGLDKVIFGKKGLKNLKKL